MKREAYWAGHLAAIEREGVSTKAYAEREGLSAAALYQWRGVLKKRATEGEPQCYGDFVAVQCAQAAPISSAVVCTLKLAGALTLELSVLPSVAWLAALGVALAREAC